MIPVPTGGKKQDVLEGMKSLRYNLCIFGADEISDYNAAVDSGYNRIIMASYGFDNRQRLVSQGEVPPEIIFDTPEDITSRLSSLIVRSRKRADHMHTYVSASSLN